MNKEIKTEGKLLNSSTGWIPQWVLNERLMFIFVLLIFCCFKWQDLWNPHYWDESWSYAVSVQQMYITGPSLLPGTIEPVYTRGHPLFYYFLASAWMKLFGASLFSKHVFSLLLSVLLLGVVFKISNRLTNIGGGACCQLFYCASKVSFMCNHLCFCPKFW